MAQDTTDTRSIRANVRVHNIYEVGEDDGKGGTRLAMMIDYSPGGATGLARITDYVDNLRPETGRKSRVNDPHSSIGQMRRVTWEAIEPHVLAFQKGQEVVVSGTALGLWPQLDMRRAEILRQCGIRTVEEFIAAPESTLMQVQSLMPDARFYRTRAQQFLQATDSAKVAAEIAERDSRIDVLKSANDELADQVRELRSMMERLMSAKIAEASAATADHDGTHQEEVRRRGRRPLPRDADGNIIRDEPAVSA